MGSLRNLKNKLISNKPAAAELQLKVNGTPKMPEFSEKVMESSVLDPLEQDALCAYDMGEEAVIEQFQYNSFDSADSDDFSDYSEFSDNEEIPTDLQTNVVKKPTQEIQWHCRKTQTSPRDNSPDLIKPSTLPPPGPVTLKRFMTQKYD